MNINQFFKERILDLIAFKANMNDIGYSDEDMTEEEWMAMFLRWMEWDTNMHTVCWGDKFAP